MQRKLFRAHWHTKKTHLIPFANTAVKRITLTSGFVNDIFQVVVKNSLRSERLRCLAENPVSCGCLGGQYQVTVSPNRLADFFEPILREAMTRIYNPVVPIVVLISRLASRSHFVKIILFFENPQVLRSSQPYSSPILLTSSSENALSYLSNPSVSWQRRQIMRFNIRRT